MAFLPVNVRDTMRVSYTAKNTQVTTSRPTCCNRPVINRLAVSCFNQL